VGVRLGVEPPLAPMEAKLVEEIPAGAGWLYEPKWDGFRSIVFRDGDDIELQSKAQKPLGRYFPEVAEAVRAIGARRFVLDGEIVVPVGKVLSFDDLLQRIHPAESRIKLLAETTPALLVVFDLLADERGRSQLARPLAERRPKLEAFAERFLDPRGAVRLSPATTDRRAAARWLSSAGGSLDGVVVKRLDQPYRTGERTAAVKIKRVRTADCVVGGFRYASKRKVVGSLLLGLYDDQGLLHHVGFTSAIREEDRKQLTKRLEGLIEPPGFTGQAPGGPSRWSTERTAMWEPLRPDLVVEVTYDHFTGGRFRHGTGFVRWRPDKLPRECTLDQVEKGGIEYQKVLGPSARRRRRRG
jgi:ATP-dependent DNA ligase